MQRLLGSIGVVKPQPGSWFSVAKGDVGAQQRLVASKARLLLRCCRNVPVGVYLGRLRIGPPVRDIAPFAFGPATLQELRAAIGQQIADRPGDQRKKQRNGHPVSWPRAAVIATLYNRQYAQQHRWQRKEFMAKSTPRRLVAICLPRVDKTTSFAERYALEMEELAGLDVALFEPNWQDPGTLATQLQPAIGVICSWGVRLDAERIAAMPECQIIASGSIGVDMVDVDAATMAGVPVTNVPDACIEEVADHGMALLLACARRMKALDLMVADGRWHQGRALLETLPRLRGQTLGLLAFGRTARALARRAQAFGLYIIAWDPYLDETLMTAAGVEPVSWRELLRRADFLSLHAVLNDETRHVLDATALRLVKPGVTIINTARGALIDEGALYAALAAGRVGAAGLDVLEAEPPAADNPLLHMQQVLVSPHCANTSSRLRPEARRRAAREVALVLRGLWPRSCVNPAVLPKTSLQRWQPYPIDHGPNR